MRRSMLLLAAMLCASLAAAAPALAAGSPYAQSVGNSEPGFTTVTLQGSVGDSSCDQTPCTVSYHFEYGKTTALGTTTPTKTASSANTGVQEGLSGLEPGTHYYFDLVVESGGQTWRRSADQLYEFTTRAHVPPTATTNDATNVTWFDAKVNGTVGNGATGYFFEWGTSPDALTNTTPVRNFGGDVWETLTNLAENTTYHFRVVAKKTDEADVRGEIKSFTTQLSPGNRDDDGDGIKNSADVCPQPGPAAGPYNQNGCPLPPDPDGDGYPNGYDGCENVKGGAQGPFNSQGCPPPPDSDGDGFIDMQDACPNEKGVQEGEAGQGCPRVDSDGDGYFDKDDACPQGPPEFAVGGPASPENGNRQGCPVKDEDKDGIADVNDKCPTAGNVYEISEEGLPTDKVTERVRPAGHKYAGCLKMKAIWYGLRGFKGFPSMKDFLKDQKFTWAMICGGACKITQTLSFDAATTKKLKLKSPVIDTISDSAPCAASGQCTGGYMFNPGPNYQIPASIKKKLAKLKKVTVLLTADLTDTKLKEKSKWQTKIEVGTKKTPKQLAEI